MSLYANIMLRTFNVLIFYFLCSLSFAQTSHVNGFFENKGQVVDQNGKPNDKVKFLLSTPGLNVQLRQSGFSYDVYERQLKRNEEAKAVYLNPSLKATTAHQVIPYSFHRIDIDFDRCNPNAQIIPEGRSADYDHYYNVSAAGGVNYVHRFQQVTYKNIYNNIDVVFLIPQDKSKPVEYNFIVYPGGKISDIRLRFKGAKTTLAAGKIRMDLRYGSMEETLPSSWIQDGSHKKSIAVNYTRIKNNLYGFETPNQIGDQTLIIDPVPTRLWGTYYSGEGQDFSTDICHDSSNNIYFSGYTWSTTNVATSGAFISSSEQYYRGCGLIVKLDSNGVRLFGVYYAIHGDVIKVDANQNIFFCGYGITASTPNVTTPGSHQPLIGGYYSNAFLVKLDATGVREWGTYYGGTRSDYGNDICIDSQNNVYLAGTAGSINNIATTGTHQPVHAPGYLDDDGFIVKFSPQGVRLWATYFGGTDMDRITSCNISDDGYLYVTGNTSSVGGIATSGSYQPAKVGYSCGMMAKFDLSGQRIWGSYFLGQTMGTIIRSKLKGNFLYLTGQTNSHDNIWSLGTFNPGFVDLPMQFGVSSYVMKFNLDTQNQVWGTYFGDYIQDIDINSSDKVFITGCTDLGTGISTPGAYKNVRQYDDAYLIKLDENGQRIWGTYYGGNVSEGVNGAADVNNDMTIDTNGSIYLIGNTDSTSGIGTPGSHQPQHTTNSLGGIYNIFLAKLQDCASSPYVTANTPVCPGGNINLLASGGTNYAWTGPNGFTSNLSNPVISNAATLHSGHYFCNITGTSSCDGVSRIFVSVVDNIKPVVDLAVLPVITGNCTTVVTNIPTATDLCSGSISGTTTDPLNYSLPGTYTIHWQFVDVAGNIQTQEQTVIISSVALPALAGTPIFCIRDTATISSIAISGQNIKWYDASTLGSLISPGTILINGQTYFASQTLDGCESLTIPVTVVVNDTPAPTGNAIQSFCATQIPTIGSINATGSNIVWYDSLSGTNMISSTVPLTDGATYYASQKLNDCESITRLAVTIQLITTLNAIDYAEILCDNVNDGSENIDLTTFNSQLISDIGNCSFEYYTSQQGAEERLIALRINTFTNYELTLGVTSIYVRIDSSNGCHQVVSLTLKLVSKPIVNIPEIIPLCENQSVAVDAGAGFDSYLWSDGSTAQTLTISTPGNFSVTVGQNHIGTVCTETKNFTTVLSNVATITSIDTNDWTDTENMIVINTSGYGIYEYSIDGIHYQPENKFLGLTSGAYTVYVRDKNGCGVTREEVFILMYPRYFSPNGDGYGDKWFIKFADKEPGLSASIFDRYGKFIKSLGNTDSWDGNLNGKQLPSDDYWFSIKRSNGKEYRGNFALKR